MGCDLHTEAERRTRFLMARVIPDKTAERSVGARLAMFAPLPAAARLSVTHDNGTGFARHARLRDEPGMATYFADPYSSWQRGGNENRNGMIRRYLPKRTIIEPGMARELQEIVDETDNRPMRALGYRTPRRGVLPTNCQTYNSDEGVALTNRQRGWASFAGSAPKSAVCMKPSTAVPPCRSAV